MIFSPGTPFNIQAVTSVTSYITSASTCWPIPGQKKESVITVDEEDLKNVFTLKFELFNDHNESSAVHFWCKENCNDLFLFGPGQVSFRTEEDAMAFKLRWME